MQVRGLDEVAALVTRSPARAGGTRIVLVDGRSGAGKTTYARDLAGRLGCRTLHMDALYAGWDGLADAPRSLVDQVLAPLADRRPAAYRPWSWVRDAWSARTVAVPADPVLVVEGVGSAAPPCRAYASLVVWLEAPTALRRERALSRDGETYRPHWDRWAAHEDTLLADDPADAAADLVVDVGGGLDRRLTRAEHAYARWPTGWSAPR